MKIVAVTNIKGGVGKTTTAVNLAFLCAAGGRATLLWDLDPPLRRAPLPSYSPRSVVAQIYSALWMEMEARMEYRPSAGATALSGSAAAPAEA
jgi:AAA domain